jgi:hypothetical protein
MVVENVRAAQKWVGPARWHYGSFYLWGDVPALMPIIRKYAKIGGHDWNRFLKAGTPSPHWGGETGAKNTGGSWFNRAHNTGSGKGRNPVKDPREMKRRPGQDAWFAETTESYQTRRGVDGDRRAASAMIAKIPLPLARYIARIYYPRAAA